MVVSLKVPGSAQNKSPQNEGGGAKMPGPAHNKSPENEGGGQNNKIFKH